MRMNRCLSGLKDSCQAVPEIGFPQFFQPIGEAILKAQNGFVPSRAIAGMELQNSSSPSKVTEMSVYLSFVSPEGEREVTLRWWSGIANVILMSLSTQIWWTWIKSAWVSLKVAPSVKNLPPLLSLQCLRTLVGHTGGVWSSQMRDNIIISGSTDRTLKVWNAETGECIHTLYGHTSTVRCMHLHEKRYGASSPVSLFVRCYVKLELLVKIKFSQYN